MLLLAMLLLCVGCHGQLIEALNQRQVASCVWWNSPFGRGVSATGGMPLQACLAHCQPFP